METQWGLSGSGAGGSGEEWGGGRSGVIASARLPPDPSIHTPADAPVAPWQRQLPNLLTMGRVVLAVVFFAMLAAWNYAGSPVRLGGGPDWWLLAAAGVFVLAAITDALDGYLARRWGVVSVFGRIMDPFADKILVIGAFVMLAGPGFVAAGGGGDPHRNFAAVAPWMVVVILARELLVTSIRGVYEGKGVSFAATASGKWKMILQSVAIPVVLVLLAVTTAAWSVWAIRGLIWATLIITVWSGLPYIMRAIRESTHLAEAPRKPAA